MSSTMRHTAEGGGEALLEKSREYCRGLTKSEAKNFYYGLKLLPEPKRSAMYALYAYMRLVDDIADTEDGRTVAQRERDLEAWRLQSHAVISGEDDAERRHILWPAFGELVRRYRIPESLFDDMIAGQRQDLEPVATATFTDLHQYCYRVASVVGLASLHVWGYEGGKATEEKAIALGVAFQLTNILRDLKEDAGRGRCYLPADELKRFGVSAEGLANGEGGEEFLELMRFQIARAEEWYANAAGLEERVEKDSRATLRAMTRIYHGILRKIAERPARVLQERVGLSVWEKLLIGWQAMRGK